MNPSIMLSILRIVVGLLFLEHGTSKVLGFPAPPLHAAALHPVPYYMEVLSAISGPVELIGGALFALGLLTRPVAFLLSGEMAVAYFTAPFSAQHLPAGQPGRAGGALLLCLSLFRLRGGREGWPGRGVGPQMTPQQSHFLADFLKRWQVRSVLPSNMKLTQCTLVRSLLAALLVTATAGIASAYDHDNNGWFDEAPPPPLIHPPQRPSRLLGPQQVGREDLYHRLRRV